MHTGKSGPDILFFKLGENNQSETSPAAEKDTKSNLEAKTKDSGNIDKQGTCKPKLA